MEVKIHIAVMWVVTPGRSVTTILQKHNASKFRAENGDCMFH